MFQRHKKQSVFCFSENRELSGKGRIMGKWVKGQNSPNAGGRPKAIAHVRELARQHTEEAIDTLTEIMLDENAKDSARVAAAGAILDRAYGKPTTYIETTLESPLMSLEEAARRIAFAMNAPGGGQVIEGDFSKLLE
jgi:hypothetical protein